MSEALAKATNGRAAQIAAVGQWAAVLLAVLVALGTALHSWGVLGGQLRAVESRQDRFERTTARRLERIEEKIDNLIQGQAALAAKAER